MNIDPIGKKPITLKLSVFLVIILIVVGSFVPLTVDGSDNMVDGNAEVESFSSRGIYQVQDVHSIRLDFVVHILGDVEYLDYISIEFFEPVEDPNDEVVQGEIEDELVLEGSFLRDVKDDIFVEIDRCTSGSNIDIEDDLGMDGDYIYEIWELEADLRLDMVDADWDLTFNEMLVEEDVVNVSVPMALNVVYEDVVDYEWEDGYFTDTDVDSGFVVRVGDDPAGELAAGEFMEAVLRVANTLTVVAGSIGAVTLILMTYKFMNPMTDGEEKKKIKEDIYRWVVGLGIIFSARGIAAVVEYIGTGEVTTWVILA